jgi:(p)ppGpp synthase/HD superfamily hydrolase
LLDTLNALSKEENNKVNIKFVEKSIIFAKKWHDKQMRKTGNHPYYWHPLSVANMLAEKYLKTDVIVASILHDVVEDSECTVELIEEKFNKRIAQIVDRLTRDRFVDGKYIKLLEETLNNLQKLDDNEALFIKQMDRLHNLQTIEGLSLKKQKKMAKETNNSFIKLIAIIGDKLNIYGKVHLENKMFKYCRNVHEIK